MYMISENRSCQNCKADFTIEAEDFVFYEKLKVPPPTFCSDCRMVRRLAWMNLTHLHKRNCDLCKESFVSMYSPQAPYVVYCPKCWWSDKWDWRDYGRGFDESKSFFSQFDELMKSTPLCGLSINTGTTAGSPYNNHAQDLKNCYLTFLSSYNKDSAYGVLVTRNTEVFDCSMVMDSDSCYDCMNIFKSSRCVGTRGNARFCRDSWFNRDCDNCADCIGCTNLKNKQYCIFNEQYTNEEYQKMKESFDIGSWKNYQNLKQKAEAFWQTQPPKPTYDDRSVDYTGSYVFESKNCKECYDVTGAENCKFLMMMYNHPTRDAYDISSWGGNLSLAYECGVVGEHSSNIRFSQESGIQSLNLEYCKLVFGSSDVFGGVSVRKGSHVILNKEYTKEEYVALRKKIISHMDSSPYVSFDGHQYSYGEFFPLKISPFGYNETVAALFNPLSEEQVQSKGLRWEKVENKSHTITMPSEGMPDHIRDASDSILNEVIGCQKCGGAYRIIAQELSYLRKMNLPLPRECPFCRIGQKFSLWAANMHLHDRTCNKCGVKFQTHYTEDHALIVSCKDCYQQAFI